MPVSLQVGHMVRDTFRIKMPVAQSPHSAVFAAIDTRTRKAVAVKAVSLHGIPPDRRDEAADRFFDSADRLEELDHPALVRPMESFQQGDTLYVIMPFVKAVTLARFLEVAPGPVSREQATDWLESLLQVTRFLHQLDPPWIIGNLDLSHIVVLSDGRVRLLNAGLAYRLERYRPSAPTSWTALEQYAFSPGSGPVGPWTDVYRIGLVATGMYTLHLPPGAPERVASPGLQVPNVETIPAGLKPLLERMLAPNAEDRYSDAAEVLDDLARWRQGEPLAPPERRPRTAVPLDEVNEEPHVEPLPPAMEGPAPPPTLPSPEGAVDEAAEDAAPRGRPAWVLYGVIFLLLLLFLILVQGGWL